MSTAVTIRPQFAIEYLRRSNQRGGLLWAQIWGVPLGVECRPMMFGSAESEHPS